MNFPMPSINLGAILPEIVLTIAACVVLLSDLYIPEDKKENVGWLSIAGLIVTFIAALGLFNKNITVFDGMFVVDNYAVFFKLAFIIISILVVLISIEYLKVEGVNKGEYYALILFSTLGMMIMAAGGDLITIYLGLELMALSSYALVGIMKKSTQSMEAALKYFLTGAFASGILLYGVALVYGVTGSFNIEVIGQYLAKEDILSNPLLILGTIFLASGFAFKVAAAPFHVWAPDVYEGAPTSVTAFLTVGSKFAGFAALVRLFMTGLILVKPYWSTLFSSIAILTMTIGNIAAVYQNNIKRLLAYSSIAHAGYVLIGVVAANKTGISSVLFYSIAYAFMNIGAFTILIILNKKGQRTDNIDNFKGMSVSNPVIAFAIMVLFLSLAGIPPTAGFAGKFLIFSSAVEANLIGLAVIGALNSVVSVYYYLRVVMVMYMDDEEQGQRQIHLPQSLCFALSIMVFFVIALGLFPGYLFEVTKNAILL